MKKYSMLKNHVDIVCELSLWTLSLSSLASYSGANANTIPIILSNIIFWGGTASMDSIDYFMDILATCRVYKHVLGQALVMQRWVC